MRVTAPNKKGFTLIELLVVIAIIALLMSIIMPALRKVKDQAKMAVCLSNTKQLTVAWIMYADENNNKLVSSFYWTPPIMHAGTNNPLPLDEQLDDLEKGPLFPYLGGSTGIYRCPTQKKDIARSYNISHAMSPDKGAAYGGLDTLAWAGESPDIPLVTKLSNIKNTSGRLVFVDEFTVTWGPWTQWYSKESWWNQPPVQHNEGTVFSFSDGHSERWKWHDDRTMELGLMSFEDYTASYGYANAPSPDNEDLHKVHRAYWGKMGYR